MIDIEWYCFCIYCCGIMSEIFFEIFIRLYSNNNYLFAFFSICICYCFAGIFYYIAKNLKTFYEKGNQL